MKRLARMIILGIGAAALLLLTGIFIATRVVDPNVYKPQIERLALQATGKRLVLQGDLALSVFPRIRVVAGPAKLLEGDSLDSAPIVRFERINASVAVWPLLTGKVEVGDVAASGVQVNLAVDKQGVPNWQSAPSGAKRKEAGVASSSGKEFSLEDVTLSSLKISNAGITYVDARTSKGLKLDVPKLTLNNLKGGQKTTLGLEATCFGLTPNPASLTLDASFILPQTLAKGARVTATGKLDAVDFTGNCFVALPQDADGRQFAANGDITLGAVDIDAYKTAPAPDVPARQESSPSASLETSDDEAIKNVLNMLLLDLRLSVKSITAAKVKISDVKVTVKADDGLLVAKPVSMLVAEGPANVEITIDGREKSIRSRVVGNWKNAKIASVAKAVAGKEVLTGTLKADWNVTAAGLSRPSILKSLNGRLAFELADGALPAFELIPKGIPGVPHSVENIAIVNSSATWNIVNGIAKNDDLSISAVGRKAWGAGQIDLPKQRVDYKLLVEVPHIAELSHLEALPIIISGPPASPKYQVDQAAILRGAAKNLLNPESKTGKKVQENIGKAFDGLLKRR